ncbi:MAG: HEAT repeat domain-containing protein [Planctomycetota bacterium]|nr:HEAT repeat domain-containing protein [Planctomycetota bacterium]
MLKAVGYFHGKGAPEAHPAQVVRRRWRWVARRRIVRYLRSGRDVGVAEGAPGCPFVTCPAPAECEGVRHLTDGVWLWPSSLAHLVERHRVVLPDELIEHMTRNRYQLPADAEPTAPSAESADAVIDADRSFWKEWCSRHASGELVLRESPDDLRGLFRAASPEERSRLVDALAPHGARATPGLIEALRCGGGKEERSASRLRTDAARILGENAAAARPAIPALYEVLEDSADPAVRLQVVRTFRAIGPPATEIISAFGEALNDDDEAVRREAVEALVELGEEAVPDLRETLERGASVGRRHAAMALGRMGGAAAAALEALQSVAADEALDDPLRHAARDAIDRIGQTTAVSGVL